MRINAVVVCVAAVAGGLEVTASAQVCSQSSPGVAEVDTSGVAVTINLAAGSVPKVNGVSCGFAASAIDVVGVGGKDTVTLNYVPPSIAVSMALGAGTNTINIYGTNAADTIACAPAGVDRDGDGTDDVDLGTTIVSKLSIYGRGGDDVIHCLLTGYKVGLYGGDGDDQLDGGAQNDTLDGGNGNDILDGHGGNDNLNGNAGGDAVIGGDGNDTLVAKGVFDGNDNYVGGPGADNLAYSGRTTPVVVGGTTGEDAVADDVETIKGGKASDTLDFSSAALPHNLYGGPGNDTLRGGAGADKLYGEAGDDLLAPGAARDTVIDAGDGNDSIAPTLDGFAETIKCGTGTDSYTANAEDTFKDCETSGSGTPIPEPPAHVAIAAHHSCAVLSTGAVKCWGFNGWGTLGQGTTIDRGAAPGDMGAALPVTDLGTGRTASSLAAGWYHTCALLDDASVKCWGNSDYGQLGLGDADVRGDAPGEMGNALPAIALGAGRTAKAIAAGGYHTCAILDDDTVKCWGDNDFGQLGLGDFDHRGDGPGEMGDALPTVDLGTGRTAVAIDADYYHTCALLDDGAVKCWGYGGWGALGQGANASIGDFPGEMGDALPPIALGSGRSALAIDIGATHSCARLDNGALKCWGDNEEGQLGDGDTTRRGDGPGEMGDALPAVDLGPGRIATAIAIGDRISCAILDDSTVKCWGYNLYGHLGQGDTLSRGDAPGEMGSALLAIALGSGRTAREISVTAFHVCAKLDNAAMKCWGTGGNGQLGYENGISRGDNPGEMGDALPVVNINGSVGFAPPPAEAGDDEALIEDPDDDSADQLDDADGGVGDDAGDDAADIGGCSTSSGGASLAFGLLALALLTRRRG